MVSPCCWPACWRARWWRSHSPQRYNIVIEAEHYNSIKPSTVVKTGDTTASNGKYTEYPLKRPHATSENSGVQGDGGCVYFKVRVPEAGTYTVWVRTWWYDA